MIEASESVTEYIRQVIPKPWFSPTQTKLFTVHPTSGNLVWEKEYMQQGARLIHLHSVVLSMARPALPGVVVMELKDHLNNVYMDIVFDLSMNGFYPLDMVINSGLIKLELTNSAAIAGSVFMTVQYQYISDKPFKLQK